MWPTRDDFRIRAENFDLSNGLNIIRIICGLFLFPHVAGKFAAGAVAAGTAGFFAKAGFHPPELWVYIAALSETAAGVAMVLGICTRFAAPSHPKAHETQRGDSAKRFVFHKLLEARGGIEPPNKGFADLCLTTWLPRRAVCFLFAPYHSGLRMSGAVRSM